MPTYQAKVNSNTYMAVRQDTDNIISLILPLNIVFILVNKHGLAQWPALNNPVGYT